MPQATIQQQPGPWSYLITSGKVAANDYTTLLDLIAFAVEAGIDLVQLREKQLSVRDLFALTLESAAIVRGSATRLLVNDRADVALAAGAHGVHLTSNSIPTNIIRKVYGAQFLIGVSCHAVSDAEQARDHAADFALVGPIFATDSKRKYGPPLTTQTLRTAVIKLNPFPIIALGGITAANLAQTLETGAAGIAGISMFQTREMIDETISVLRGST